MLDEPKITYFGEARDVVLGIAFYGGDLDGSFVPDFPGEVVPPSGIAAELARG